MPTRLAHFSDVHLTARPLGFRPSDWFGKRFTGWVNLRVRGRGRSFRHAPAAAAAMMRAVRERRPDGLVFSGDATGLGFEAELIVAARSLGVHAEDLPPAVAVPGNHDYYTRRAATGGLFEEHFGPWQEGVRADAGHRYPFARRVGDVWLVCVNSSRANRWHGDASGKIGPEQLARLRTLCDGLAPGPRVLVTHYPLRTAEGELETPLHRLRDHAEALKVAAECGVALWLHGHIHKGFVLPATREIPFPVVCVGSSTQTKRWSYHEYTIDGHTLDGVVRTYDLDHDTFRDAAAFQLELPG